MKNILFTSFAVLCACAAHSQTKINIDSAAKHIGEKVIICSKVYGVKLIPTSQMTFIDLGGKYPNSLLTIVIPAKAMANFKQTPEALYAGKNICITGTIISYKGKAEIELLSPKDVSVE